MAENAEKKKAGGDGATLQAVLDKKSEEIGYEVLEEESMSGSRVRAKLKIADADFEGRLKETLKEFTRQIRLPGFRPGKAPVQLVRKNYEKEAREETIKRMVDRLTDLYSESKGYDRLSPPYLLDSKSSKDEGTTVEIAFEVRPEINVSDDTVKDLKINVHKIPVNDDYLNKALENLRDRSATYEPTEDPYSAGDGITFDCTVRTENGEVIPERSVTGYYTQKLTEEVPEEVAAAMVGKKKGEEFELTLDEENEFKPGTTEKVFYEVTVHEVKKKNLPELDDEFAKDVSEDLDTLDDLKKKIQEDLGTQEENRKREEALNEVFSLLRDRLEFDLPKALVDETTNRSIGDMEKRLNQYGTSLKHLDQSLVKSYAASMREQAKINVKNSLILKRLSEFWDVSPTEEQINEHLEKIANDMGRKPLAVRAQLEARKQWDQFVEDLSMKLTNDVLLEKAEMKETETTIEKYEEIQQKRQEEQAAKLRGEKVAEATEEAPDSDKPEA